MVVPDEVMDAAEAGNLAAVREWLESGGDANDTDSSGSSTLLILVARAGPVLTDAKTDVARLLLLHGADVNRVTGDRYNPAHCCAIYPEESNRGPLIQVLLDAGVNVNATHIGGETPLGTALTCSIWDTPDQARACLDFITRLLRAGAALDAIAPNNSSAEDMLRVEEDHNAGLHPGLPPDFYACKTLVSDYRAAGSNWKSYVRVLPKELLRLRSLVARGRAQENMHATRTRTKTPREIALLFSPTFPNELFWKVASYWNPRY